MVAHALATVVAKARILLLEDDEDLSDLFIAILEDAGYDVHHVENGRKGLDWLKTERPDLIISDIIMPEMDGLTFLRTLRMNSALRFLPVLLLTSKRHDSDIQAGFAFGADKYVAKPVDPAHLLQQIEEELSRDLIPAEEMAQTEPAPSLDEPGLHEIIEATLARDRRSRRPSVFARVDIYERARLVEYLGGQAVQTVSSAFEAILKTWARPDDVFARGSDGDFLIFMPGLTAERAQDHLEALTRTALRTRLTLNGEEITVTPLAGCVEMTRPTVRDDMLEATAVALAKAENALDLRPVAYSPSMIATAGRAGPRWIAALKARLLFPRQIAATYAVGLCLPFMIYVAAGTLGITLTPYVYTIAVVYMSITCVLIWCEGGLSMTREDPPDIPDADHGPITAVIAAYLPNEAPTILSTIKSFLEVDYPTEYKVILAYNTPTDMPIEDRLREIADADPRFVPLRVANSRSKAQNVNAALSLVKSPVVAVYDADHQPDPDSFRRAWAWIASGADVVQGHCLIRNGDASWVARTVAVEFEMIYGVNHFGRARLHGFGLFGGSNGFWRTSLLRELRMRGSMLTEDIDASVRAVQLGCKIVSDPHLVSRELSPTTLKGLTNQRLRWAQGWFQVMMKQWRPTIRARHMSIRQKAGMLHLLVWREIFPWLSMQILPIIVYDAWQAGGFGQLQWGNSFLLWLTILIFLTGPGQIPFTYRNADPEIKARKAWFFSYLVVSLFFYTWYKNVLARVANLKQLHGESDWKVTPRS